MKRFQKKTALTLLLGTFRSISGEPCTATEVTDNGYTTKECDTDGNPVGQGCSYKHIKVSPYNQPDLTICDPVFDQNFDL